MSIFSHSFDITTDSGINAKVTIAENTNDIYFPVIKVEYYNHKMEVDVVMSEARIRYNNAGFYYLGSCETPHGLKISKKQVELIESMSDYVALKFAEQYDGLSEYLKNKRKCDYKLMKINHRNRCLYSEQNIPAASADEMSFDEFSALAKKMEEEETSNENIALFLRLRALLKAIKEKEFDYRSLGIKSVIPEKEKALEALSMFRDGCPVVDIQNKLNS